MSPKNRDSECVVLVHGLALGSWVMAPLARAIARPGRRVVSRSYRSRTEPLEQLGDRWLAGIVREVLESGAARVHLVAHSLGGLVVRRWLAGAVPPGSAGAPRWLGRVVLIGTPNHGTPVVDGLLPLRAFRWIAGVNGVRLGVGAGSLPSSLPAWPADVHLGVVAGSRRTHPFFERWLPPGPADGVVPVSSTALEGMREHLVLPCGHTTILWRRSTWGAVGRFLDCGSFSAAGAPRSDIGGRVT